MGVDPQVIDARKAAHLERRERKRARAVELYEHGESYRGIAARLGVTHHTVRRWVDPRVAEAEKDRKRRQREQPREPDPTPPMRPPSPFDLMTSGGRVEGGRRRMPVERRSLTHEACVDGFTFYVTVGLWEDGTPGEVFIKGAGQEGSTVQGLFDALAIMWTLGIQHGASFDLLARRFAHMRFAPLGHTDNPDIPWASSIVDYVIRWMALHFGDEELNADLAEVAEEMRRPFVER